MMPAKKPASFAPAMFQKDEEMPLWKKPKEVDMKAMDQLF